MGLFTPTRNQSSKVETCLAQQPAGQKALAAAHTRSLLDKYVQQLKKLYGDYLKNVILFGSYARGDFNEESDVDVMILLDLDDKGIEDYDDSLCGITYDFNMENDIDIQIVTQNYMHFLKWKKAHPFYKNVMEEGVILYDAA